MRTPFIETLLRRLGAALAAAAFAEEGEAVTALRIFAGRRYPETAGRSAPREARDLLT